MEIRRKRVKTGRSDLATESKFPMHGANGLVTVEKFDEISPLRFLNLLIACRAS